VAERFTASLAIASDPACFREARAWLSVLARRAGLDHGAAHDVLVAFSEACANAYRHAYDGRRDGRIEIDVRHEAGELEVRVRDFGRSFDPEGVPEPEFEDPREGGYGVFLMRNLMDDVRFAVDGEGTEVAMTKRAAVPVPVARAAGGG
jgi:serine/threonine-protein kinase RsbW